MAVELACALDRERFSPHVLVTRGDGPLRDLLENAGVSFTILNRRRVVDLSAWRCAYRTIKTHADLVHSHKFGSNAWGALLARRASVPLVAHEHNFSDQPSRLRAFIDRRWIASKAARLMCVSESVAQTELESGVPAEIVETVLNGVRIDDAISRDQARSVLGLDTKSCVIGIVGRLRPEKAHEVLLEAVAELAHAGRDVRLCVVGDGPRRSELQLLAAKLGIDSRVKWAGEKANAAKLASAFDLAVTCSHWEGLPLASMEAMAVGVPLVASSVGGLPTLLGGGAGLLVEPGNPSALARNIEKLVDDRELRLQVGLAGKKRIEESYSFEAMVQKVESIYDDVLADSNMRSSDSANRSMSIPNDGAEAA